MICEDCHEPIKGASTGICSSCAEFPGWRHELVAIRFLGYPYTAEGRKKQRELDRKHARRAARDRMAEHARLAAEQRQRTASEIMEAAE